MQERLCQKTVPGEDGGDRLRYDVGMIGSLQGTVQAVRGNHCLIAVGGIGYKVFTAKDVRLRMTLGQKILFWTHLAVREDALDLYGFESEEELKFFELLLTVSGIGPKSALGILDVAAVETLRSAISTANASYLTNVSGIGKKTAEKIVLELKDKLSAELGGVALPKGDAEALEAMRSLGYSANEAREALRKVPASIEKSGERLREALRVLGTQ